ncbi:glycophorin B isoform X1 [Bos taurus]|uniref:glycophorin B isoform X1 n=1 Tax=Bos taurus TaxID=9913 RepID=UPI000572AD88|nr:glycophorin B isoform X1 [Bos taurus]
MDRKLIFVLLLSGYIFTKPVAAQTPGPPDTPGLPAMVIAILALIAGIIGITIGSVSLFFILQMRNQVSPRVSETPGQTEQKDLPQ